MSDNESGSGSDNESVRPSFVPALTPRGQEMPVKASYDEESNIHGKINITIVLPDKSEIIREFSLGDTVFNIKKYVHDNKGLEWKGMKASLDGKAMLDPLSLNDFPALKGKSSATVVIEV
tara:strand:- start:126 stop:485 length:360 start_codon:yes stop_codon:yes gene_type:complete